MENEKGNLHKKKRDHHGRKEKYTYVCIFSEKKSEK